MFRAIVLLAVVSAAFGGILKPRVPLLDGRIVGGEATTIERFPYQISLRFLGSHSCGGSIIGSNTILTAAHCIMINSPSVFTVQYGLTNTNSRDNVVAVSRVVKHPQYNSNTIDHDVALVFLAENIVFGSNAQPIQLADENPAPGTPAVVSGWGVTEEDGQAPKTLQKVDIEIVSPAACAKSYAGVNDITDRMLCAAVVGGGKDACQGDSGGPLAANGRQVGIVSWGVGCARPAYPGVYSSVANLRGWIRENSGI